jgi:hypothetical protein
LASGTVSRKQHFGMVVGGLPEWEAHAVLSKVPHTSRRLAVACALIGVLLVVPATARASFYLSRAQATAITKNVARKKALGRVDSAYAACYPSFRAHTAANLRKRWHQWDCGWSLGLTKAGGSKGVCSGKLRLTGTRRGSKYRSRGGSCKTLSGVAPAPAPTPSPAPAPSPSPHPAGPSQQDIINYTYSFAGSVGQAHLSAVNHTFRATVNGCTMVQADTGRCTVWRWVDAGIYGTDPTTGYDVHRIEFYRIYAFAEWLTTDGIYNTWAQDYDIVDPAQACYATLSPSNVLGALYGCSPLTPGA